MTVHTYIVRKGESAQSVSEKFKVTLSALTRENETPFYEGQQVTVPVGILERSPSGHDLPGYYQVPESSILERQDVVNIIFL